MGYSFLLFLKPYNTDNHHRQINKLFLQTALRVKLRLGLNSGETWRPMFTWRLYSLLFQRTSTFALTVAVGALFFHHSSTHVWVRSTNVSARGSCGNTSSTSMGIRSSSSETRTQAKRTRSTHQLFAQNQGLSLKMMLRLLFTDHFSCWQEKDSSPDRLFNFCCVWSMFSQSHQQINVNCPWKKKVKLYLNIV